jgi:hypothetical protein
MGVFMRWIMQIWSSYHFLPHENFTPRAVTLSEVGLGICRMGGNSCFNIAHAPVINCAGNCIFWDNPQLPLLAFLSNRVWPTTGLTYKVDFTGDISPYFQTEWRILLVSYCSFQFLNIFSSSFEAFSKCLNLTLSTYGLIISECCNWVKGVVFMTY